MASFTQRQKAFISKFHKHSARVMEFGFAYMFSHEEHLPAMNSVKAKVQSMMRLQEQQPEMKTYCQRSIQQTYIDYIVLIVQLAFKYVKYHPEMYKEIANFREVFDEYDELKKDLKIVDTNQKRQSLKPKLNIGNFQRSSESSEESLWEEIYSHIKAISSSLESAQEKDKSKKAAPGLLRSSSETLHKFNVRLENMLKEVKKRRKPVPAPKVNKTFKREEQMIKIREQRRLRPNEALTVPRSAFVNNHSEGSTSYESNSEHNTSEELLSFEQFSDTPTVGNIERHLVVPIQSRQPSKITPRFSINKSPTSGSMHIDLMLSFEDGILYQNKLVDGIRIESILPPAVVIRKIRNYTK